MLDDISYSDEAHERYMRRASQTLASCIARARAGEPTYAPQGLAGLDRRTPQRSWTPEDIAQLRDMRGRGMTSGQISQKIGRPFGSVKDAVRRYVLSGGR